MSPDSPVQLLPESRRGLLLGVRGWSVVIGAVAIVALVVPLLNLAVPAGNPLHLGDWGVALVAKIMCYAMCALAMDLVWGYTGILSLGHGLYFALGGYAMGMYLMRQIGRDGNYRSELPDFMVFLDWKTLPWHWAGSDSLGVQLFLVVAVPAGIALGVMMPSCGTYSAPAMPLITADSTQIDSLYFSGS